MRHSGRVDSGLASAFAARRDAVGVDATLPLAADPLLPRLLPLQEFAEQRLALIGRRCRTPYAFLLQEGCELGGRCGLLLRIDALGLAKPLQHLFRDAPTGPPRHRCGEIDITPFRMPRRLLELVKLG